MTQEQLVQQQCNLRECLEQCASELAAYASVVLAAGSSVAANRTAALGWLERAEMVMRLAESIPDKGPVERLAWIRAKREDIDHSIDGYQAIVWRSLPLACAAAQAKLSSNRAVTVY